MEWRARLLAFVGIPAAAADRCAIAGSVGDAPLAFGSLRASPPPPGRAPLRGFGSLLASRASVPAELPSGPLRCARPGGGGLVPTKTSSLLLGLLPLARGALGSSRCSSPGLRGPITHLTRPPRGLAGAFLVPEEMIRTGFERLENLRFPFVRRSRSGIAEVAPGPSAVKPQERLLRFASPLRVTAADPVAVRAVAPIRPGCARLLGGPSATNKRRPSDVARSPLPPL